MQLSDFDFDLPQELIASRPLPNRSASRMLVVDTECRDDHIINLPNFLRPGDVLVINDSRVIPARFDATATDGKTYEITLHSAQNGAWLGMCRGSNKINIGDKLTLGDETKIEVVGRDEDGSLEIKFLTNDVFATLDRVGHIPLPPYMKREDDADDRERYQTIYADPDRQGSFAAPTAGLHFTPELMAAVLASGAKIARITLHVGAGTFLPVRTDNISNHKMHAEFGEISAEAADLINSAKRVIAVGTTSLRLLESATSPLSRVKPFCGTTDIFITPGYKFRTADILLTNFHLPKSTLFMLVSAFAGAPEMKAAYAHAIREKYRFFSYGDCCLLYKKEFPANGGGVDCEAGRGG
ncbi:MAG: tRNA preQ1(34) S-adenosylmethionine ribosyltransferase-isomerase QueA [Rickettsiales bacterium]|jgi:S-adenosylmethionine:tRNA ribosyltransferase-isomerase|nr:tRNA preQ1(34) S-adenosylmethionine ribosyltransferase-isomerase QueA [Rickettsiales bacterium]